LASKNCLVSWSESCFPVNPGSNEHVECGNSDQLSDTLSSSLVWN
jgi:hypothetical protein